MELLKIHLKRDDCKRDELGIARMLLGSTSVKSEQRLDVSHALKRWRDRQKTEQK